VTDSPKREMTAHEARRELDEKKKQIRELRDLKLIESMQVMGVRLVHLDRAELLGLICYLAQNQKNLVKDDSPQK
jgi:hypothetical protein